MFSRAMQFTENLAVLSLLVASSAALHLAVARTRRRREKQVQQLPRWVTTD